MRAIYYSKEELAPFIKASREFREQSEKRGEEDGNDRTE